MYKQQTSEPQNKLHIPLRLLLPFILNIISTFTILKINVIKSNKPLIEKEVFQYFISAYASGKCKMKKNG